MFRLKYLNIILPLVIVTFNSCKTPSLVQESTLKPVPSLYTSAANSDTTNIADVNWKTFFPDPVLVSLIDTALKNSPDLLMALQRIEAAHSDVIFTKGLLFPTIGGFAAGGQEKTGEYSVNWAGNEGGTYASGDPLLPTYQDYYTGFLSSWEIDVWGKLRNKKKAAVLRYLASMEGRNWVITGLVAEVAKVYYELIALDNQLEIITETIKLQEDALNIVRAQKSAGVANELAVKQFEAQLLNSKGLEKEILQQITETENLLNFLLGRFPQPIERKPALFNDSVPSSIQAGIPSQLLQYRPDIRQAEYELLASKADVKSARAAFFPSLNITASVGFNAFNPTYLFLTPKSIAYNAFGNLAAPLINRSAIKAEFKRANAGQVEALYNYQKSILNGYVEVANELSNINNLEERYDLKTQEVDVLTQSIETSSDLFKTGRATYLEVLLTQQNALHAKLELTDTRMEQYQAMVNIYRALGGGWR